MGRKKQTLNHLMTSKGFICFQLFNGSYFCTKCPNASFLKSLSSKALVPVPALLDQESASFCCCCTHISFCLYRNVKHLNNLLPQTLMTQFVRNLSLLQISMNIQFVVNKYKIHKELKVISIRVNNSNLALELIVYLGLRHFS